MQGPGIKVTLKPVTAKYLKTAEMTEGFTVGTRLKPQASHTSMPNSPKTRKPQNPGASKLSILAPLKPSTENALRCMVSVRTTAL